MSMWDRLSNLRRWASGGGVSEPSDAQSNQGFAYLPNGKPTVEGFNALFQWNDDAHNWFFRQLRGVLVRAGMTPTEAGDNQLADALRALRSVPPLLHSVPGTTSYTVPPNIARVLVFCTGGGGGSTAADAPSALTTGAGGGAGGTAIGFYPVSGGSQVPVLVGAGGGAGGVQGGAGGTSSFGAFCSASGGFGGVLAGGATISGGGGGSGSGGLLNLSGGAGSDGHSSIRYPTGYGGASIWGGGQRAGFSVGGVPGGDAPVPGGGGGARYTAPDGGSSGGGKGAAGLVLVVPLA